MNHKLKAGNLATCQQQEFLDILDRAQIGVFKSTPEGKYVFVNQALARMYGYDSPQELMDSVQDIDHQVYQDPQQRQEFLGLLHEQGEVLDHEACLLRKDGSQIWVCRSAWVVRDEKGEVSYYLGFSTDVSTQKQMQENLRQQKRLAEFVSEQWQSTFDAIPDPIMLIDLDYRILRANQAMANRLRCEAKDLLGLYCYQVVHAQAEPPWFCPHSKSLQSKVTERAEISENQLGGVYDVTTTPIFNYQQEMFGSVHVARDITEHKTAERNLQESESLLRGITDAALDAILIMDDQGRISFWNPAAESIFGYSAQEVLGQDLHQKLAPKEYLPDFEQAFPEFQRTGQGGAMGQILELEALRKHGERITISLSLSAFKRKDRWHALGIVRDITEQKRIQQELLQAKQDAEAANTAKSEFLANMSHEIRTPLNGIMGVMQLLQSSNLDGELMEYVEIANSAADRLARLLSDILDLSVVEAGKLELEKEPFSLNALCETVSNLFLLQTRDKGVELECFIDPNLPERVLGDEKRVEQILFNLVGNALKYTKQGQVRLEIVPIAPESDQSFRLLFSVIDTGMGISQEQQDKLFQPFVQADGSYTRKFQGAGLGLSIVHRLVKIMSGNIALESEPGEGTAVHVVLPFSLPADAKSGQIAGDGSRPGAGTGLHILVAEDDDSNQIFLKKLLQKHGHKVSLAATGQEALEMFSENDFDCILMDVQMPIMDGVEVTRRIREEESREQRGEGMGHGAWGREQREEGMGHGAWGKEQQAGDAAQSPDTQFSNSSISQSQKARIPIIALTAYAMSGDREKFLRAGMDDYLAKPVEQDDLFKVLQNNVYSTKASYARNPS
jgi:PAS domain S-box-containing protein